MRLHADRLPVASGALAIAKYPEREFASPFRSTVPLVSLLLNGSGVWDEILTALDLERNETNAHLEYRVDTQAGTGKPSQTDVMLISGDRAIAVEAKWTEPEYDSVDTWLKAGGDNRASVLEGWLGPMAPHCGGELGIDSVRQVTYQTVHRAASACVAGRKPGIAYLVFTPGPDGTQSDTSHLERSLERLRDALHPSESLAL
jgi:hypothetical protein